MSGINSIKKGFDSEPVCNEKHLKAKIIFYEGKVNTNVHDDEMLKEGSQCIFLLVILTNSVFKIVKIYYPQVFLEGCKYIVKEEKVSRFIGDDLFFFPDDSD